MTLAGPSALAPVLCLTLGVGGGSSVHHCSAPKHPEQEQTQRYLRTLEAMVGLWQGRRPP